MCRLQICVLKTFLSHKGIVQMSLQRTDDAFLLTGQDSQLQRSCIDSYHEERESVCYFFIISSATARLLSVRHESQLYIDHNLGKRCR